MSFLPRPTMQGKVVGAKAFSNFIKEGLGYDIRLENAKRGWYLYI